MLQHEEYGHTHAAAEEIKEIFGRKAFDTPKPKKLIMGILELALPADGVVLDSFAGSATTAHAALALNAEDGGDRKFILVECEDYADKITAERVRRVIKGYEFTGTQREELLREKITFTSLKKSDELLHKIEGIENLEKHRFDTISKTVKDGVLIVSGERAVKERTEGLGGSFTYCTLGSSQGVEPSSQPTQSARRCPESKGADRPTTTAGSESARNARGTWEGRESSWPSCQP